MRCTPVKLLTYCHTSWADRCHGQENTHRHVWTCSHLQTKKRASLSDLLLFIIRIVSCDVSFMTHESGWGVPDHLVLITATWRLDRWRRSFWSSDKNGCLGVTFDLQHRAVLLPLVVNVWTISLIFKKDIINHNVYRYQTHKTFPLSPGSNAYIVTGLAPSTTWHDFSRDGKVGKLLFQKCLQQNASHMVVGGRLCGFAFIELLLFEPFGIKLVKESRKGGFTFSILGKIML